MPTPPVAVAAAFAVVLAVVLGIASPAASANPAGTTTSYGYDAMGRLASCQRPA